MIGRSLIAMAIAAAALAAMTSTFSSTPRPTNADDQAMVVDGSGNVIATKAADESKPSASYGAEVRLPRGDDSHFRADVMINGSHVTMLIDSGATMVGLNRRDASALGITTNPDEFTGTAQTAGGTVKVKPVVLDRVELGGIVRSKVDAVVVDTDLPISLLGQSFLKQIASVSVQGDEMILK